jgi:hypothetical protein
LSGFALDSPWISLLICSEHSLIAMTLRATSGTRSLLLRALSSIETTDSATPWLACSCDAVLLWIDAINSVIEVMLADM